MSKRILVTGADGFIGSHLTEALVRERLRCKSFCYIILLILGVACHCHEDVTGEFEVFQGDIKIQMEFELLLQDAMPSFFIFNSYSYSYHSPDTYVETNMGH